MIRTQEEYTNACAFIDSDMELYDFQLSEKMSSYEYNLYLQDTEYFLNFLYEKIRTLEELCDYLEQYADTRIRNAKKELEADYGLLSKSIDIYMDNKTTSIAPSWNDNISKNLRDRDGSVLPVAEVKYGQIGPHSRRNNIVKPQLMIKRGSDEAYQDNLMDAIRDGQYLTAYQHAYYIPVEDRIEIMLPEGAEFNSVEMEPIHCKISVEQNETGLIVTMYPEGYDKELRNFDFAPYTGSTLDLLTDQKAQYDQSQTITDNQNKQDNKRRQKQIAEYIHDIRVYQDTVKRNTDKAKTIGSV